MSLAEMIDDQVCCHRIQRLLIVAAVFVQTNTKLLGTAPQMIHKVLYPYFVRYLFMTLNNFLSYSFDICIPKFANVTWEICKSWDRFGPLGLTPYKRSRPGRRS